jgi:ATP-binding cassette subfamily B protein
MSRMTELAGSVRIARRFSGELRESRGRMIWIAVGSLLLAGADILRPWPVSWIIDGALTDTGAPFTGDLTTKQIIWIGGLAVLVIAVAKALLQYARDLGVAQVGHLTTRRLRHRIFAHLSKLSPAFHAKHKSGDLLMRLMGDVPMVTTMMVDSAVELGTRAVLAIGIVIVMFSLDPLLTLLVFTTVPVLLLTVRWLSSQIRVAVRKQRRKEGKLADYLQEALGANDVIQTLGSSDEVVREFARGNRRNERAGLKAKRIAARLAASVESLLGLALAMVLLLGSLRVLDESLTLGQLTVFLSYVRSLQKPIRSASKHAVRIAKGSACGERILALLDEQPGIENASDARLAPPKPARLAFEAVHYSYPDGAHALRGLDVEFRAGELSAVVGASGVGKSTAALLACRLIDPDRGRVTLDGQPLRELTIESLRERIGVCLQDTRLFGASIRENLLLAQADATDEQLIECLRRAGADFVAQLEDGLDTMLGSDGVGLSGGQRHRLSLARTLLRDPDVLVVDEPFAGLDGEGVRHLSRTLGELSRERLVIVIAHDLHALEQYDRIVFLKDGRAHGEGRHADLLEDVPEYRAVIRAGSEVLA